MPEGVFSHRACLGFSSGRPHGTGAGGAELWEVGAANKGVLSRSGPGLIPLGTFRKLCPTPWRSTQKIPRRPENPIPGAAPWGFIPFLLSRETCQAASRSRWKSAAARGRWRVCTRCGSPHSPNLPLTHWGPTHSSRGQFS